MAINTTTGYAEVNGARLYYETIGSGLPVVFVHAGIADHRMWGPQVAPFAERYRVICYDMRGYGQSAMVPGDFAHRDDLVGLLDHLAVERGCLVGCSMGGSTAIDFAVEHPDRLAALVMVDSRARGLDIGAEPTGEPEWEEIVAAFKAGDLERVARLDVKSWVAGPTRTLDQIDPAIGDLVYEMDLIALRNEKLALGADRPLDPPAGQRLADLKAPLLVLVGDRDNPDELLAGEALVKAVPGAQHAIIAGAAHLPGLEKPAEFNRIVLDFLQGVGD
jgi:pimeloyl-ACP methyl ester carboxylesterase